MGCSTHLSTLILTGQITKEESEKLIKAIPYPSEKDLIEDVEYFLKKMKWTEEDLKRYLSRPPKSHTDFGSEIWLWKTLGKVWSSIKKMNE